MSCRIYVTVSSRSSGGRGFKLRSSKRFSVQALRARFLFIFRILKKWTYAYCRALKFLKKGVHLHDHYGLRDDRRIGKMSQFGSSRSMNGLFVDDFMPRSHEYRRRSLARSDSFYSEAIADCLEFIKRNSVSSNEDEKAVSQTIDELENNLNINKIVHV